MAASGRAGLVDGDTTRNTSPGDIHCQFNTAAMVVCHFEVVEVASSGSAFATYQGGGMTSHIPTTGSRFKIAKTLLLIPLRQGPLWHGRGTVRTLSPSLSAA